MPLGNAHHGGRREPFDLQLRIEMELRARIEDAVDNTCLAAMVSAREAIGAAPPAADSLRDREEYVAHVLAFLEMLRVEIVRELGDEQRRRLGGGILEPQSEPTIERGAVDCCSDSQRASVDAAVSIQVSLAKELPDYWQRFEAVRARCPDVDVTRLGRPSDGRPAPADSSGRQSRSLLDRLLRRG